LNQEDFEFEVCLGKIVRLLTQNQIKEGRKEERKEIKEGGREEERERGMKRGRMEGGRERM
jgi:hypothetical protein